MNTPDKLGIGENNPHNRKKREFEKFKNDGVKIMIALFGALLISAAATEMESCEKQNNFSDSQSK